MYLILRWEAAGRTAELFSARVGKIMSFMGIVNFIYAGICAIVLFGDLFKTKSCYALHSMPLRREEWFLTHCISGFLFCLIPNLLGALITYLLIPTYWDLVVIWLGLMLLQFLFFFGVGAFSVMCTGNRLGAVTIYVTFNYLGEILQWFYSEFYRPHLSGFLDYNPALQSPVCYMTNSRPFSPRYLDMGLGSFTFNGLMPENWRYLLIIAAVGLILLVSAALLYRRRKLEHAGNFIVLRPVRFLFVIIGTLFIGTVIRDIAKSVSYKLLEIFLVLGITIGFFTIRMLIERKVNVFGKKNLLAFGALLAAFIASVGLTVWDPLDLTGYVPNPDHVSSVEFSFGFGNGNPITLSNPDDIAVVTDAHESLIKHPSSSKNTDIYLTYKLRGGIIVRRHYQTSHISNAALSLSYFHHTWQDLLRTNNTDTLLENAYCLHFQSSASRIPDLTIAKYKFVLDSYPSTAGPAVSCLIDDLVPKGEIATGLKAALLESLMDAIKKDCEAGKLIQSAWDCSGTHRDISGVLTIKYYENSKEKHLKINIYSNCTNTLECIKTICEQSKKPG